MNAQKKSPTPQWQVHNGQKVFTHTHTHTHIQTHTYTLHYKVLQIMLLFSFADDKITDYQYHCVIHYRGYNTKMQNKETGMSGMLLLSMEWRCMELRHGGGGGGGTYMTMKDYKCWRAETLCKKRDAVMLPASSEAISSISTNK